MAVELADTHCISHNNNITCQKSAVGMFINFMFLTKYLNLLLGYIAYTQHKMWPIATDVVWSVAIGHILCCVYVCCVVWSVLGM